MTYVSRKERIFDLPDPCFQECSPPLQQRSDHRLKNFPSVNDHRAWKLDEWERYRHLYSLVSGSETCLTSKSGGFKYIPFDVLLTILMAEKDAYICELCDKIEKLTGRRPEGTRVVTPPGRKVVQIAPTDPMGERTVLAPAGRTGQLDQKGKQDYIGQVEKIGHPSVSDSIASGSRRKSTQEHSPGRVSILSKPGTPPQSIYRGSQTRPESSSGSLKSVQKDSVPIDELYRRETPVYRRSTQRSVTDEPETEIEMDERFVDETGSNGLVRKEAEIIALKNKIGSLQAELSECRDTLRKAMHKLENIDDILNENDSLRKKLRCSEELIQWLQDNNKALEKEVENLRSKSEIQFDLDQCQRGLQDVCDRAERAEGDHELLERLAQEQEDMQAQVESLKCELSLAKLRAKDVELLKKQSEAASINLEEVSRENECYKKKLETMKSLEKQIEELKHQAQGLTNRYREESRKSTESMKQMTDNARELSMLKDERDRLLRRVEELASYEAQYNALQGKLYQVESILSENELLRARLQELDRVEMENQQLRKRCEQLRSSEREAESSKQTILELNCAIADQEDEMKDALRQIERLSKSYEDQGDVCRLKSELAEKSCKLRLCEQQLAEIPFLEAEIDQLRHKLQKCIEDFQADQKLVKSLQNELDCCRKKCCELELELLQTQVRATALPPPSSAPAPKIFDTSACEDVAFQAQMSTIQEIEIQEIATIKTTSLPKIQNEISQLESSLKNKGAMTCEEVQKLLQSSKAIISCVLEDMIEHQKEMEELERYNRAMKNEIEMLKTKMGKPDLDNLLKQIAELKSCIEEKDKRIAELECQLCQACEQVNQFGDLDELMKRMCDLEAEIACLRALNEELREEVECARSALEKIAQLEALLEAERKARAFAEEMNKQMEAKLAAEFDARRLEGEMGKLQKEESNLTMQERCKSLMNEISDLKRQIEELNKLVAELKKENALMKEMQGPCPDLSKELAEKQALEDLLANLQAELDSLRSGLANKTRLDDEYDALRAELKRMMEDNDRLKANLAKVQAELVAGLKGAESETMAKVLEQKDQEISNLKKDLEARQRETESLRNENQKLKDEMNALEAKYKNMEDELNRLRNELARLNGVIKDQENTIAKQKSELDKANELLKSHESELASLKESIKAKDAELGKLKGEISNLTEITNKLKSENDVMKNRLKEVESSAVPKYDFEKDLAEKHALEEAMRNLEAELDSLRKKLQECKKGEDELARLKAERDEAMKKLKDYENQIAVLKSKADEADRLRSELEKEKTARQAMEDRLNRLPATSSAAEEKLLQEIVGLREQISKLQDEINRLKDENKRVKDLLEKTTRSLQEAEASLGKSSKGVSAAPSAASRGPQSTPIPPAPCPSCPECPTSPESVSINYDSIDPSFKEFEKMMSHEDHKKNIIEIENRYMNKMRKLEDSNADKVKILIEQYEKEKNNRNKTFNENVGTVKNGYETDIRKLTERHKSSIMRLQALHEDEVQELNTQYETQMEAMQTQNENVVTDLTSGAADKFKKLTEQHNHDVKDLETKFQQLLDEKETQHLYEISNLQSNLTQNMEEVEQFHKKTMDSLTSTLEGNISEIQAKHGMELKKLKRGNLKRVDMMKHKYEDLLMEERKKYEEQLEKMLDRLRKGQQGDQVECECKFMGFKPPKKPRDPNAPLEFIEVLEKIINEGLDSLNFNEIALVHRKTCFAAEGLVMDPEVKAELEPSIGDGCPHTPLMSADKEQLLHRIFVLENEIGMKQVETQEAIVNMEMAVKAERRRLQDLRNSLHNEQQKNSELKLLLSSQSRMHTDLKIERDMLDRQASMHENRVMEKVKELEKERADKRCVEEELQKEKNNVKHLTMTLDCERDRFKTQRKRDSEYLESMRVRLEHALNNEHRLETQLDYEAQSRAKLECELESLQRSFHLMVDLPAVGGKREIPQVLFETKKAKDKQNLDQCDAAKDEDVRRSRSKSKTPKKCKK